MPRALWSEQAEAELEALVPDLAVKVRLRKNTETALHHVTACTADEGAEGEIMWRRGITEEQRRQLDAGWFDDVDDGAQPWDYFVFYRAAPAAAFEVLAVRSIRQVAAWELRYGLLGRYARPVPVLAACAGESGAADV
jgi:hypothetical protein